MLTVRYDLTRQPYSIGDPITTAVAGSIIADERGHDAINFAFVGADIEHLKRRAMQVAPTLAPMVKTVSFHVEPGADVWPEEDAPYLFYRINDEIVSPYFEKHGRVPKLTTGMDRPYYAPYVSINLRHSRGTPERNSNLPAWQRFMLNHPEQTFITIGDVHRDGETRHQMFIPDMAVIEHSAFHMGTVSGPCELVKFSDKPYACFGLLRGEKERGLKSWSNGRWAWAKPGQTWTDQPETVENLEAAYQAWRNSGSQS